MDLTPVFNDLLSKHNAPQTGKKYSVADIDGFLKDAYRIVGCDKEDHTRQQLTRDRNRTLRVYTTS